MPKESEDRSLGDGDLNFVTNLLEEASLAFPGNLTEKHVEMILERLNRLDDLKYKKWKQGRLFLVVNIFMGIGLFVFLTIFLAKPFPETFLEIVRILLAFIAGFGGGYGIKSLKNASE